MDADPLYHIKQLFHRGSYKAAIDEASDQPLTPGGEAALQRAVYVARAHLALSPPAISAAEAVLKPFLALDPRPPAASAAAALASYLGGDEDAVDSVRDLVIEVEGGEVGEEWEEGMVRALAGTIFILDKENEEAVATLNEGKGHEDLECLAILAQLLLALDRRDLANATYATAKRIGNDSTIVQAIEAWIGLKTGSRPLHQAYYFYEELYQLPAGRTPGVLASHAAAHLLLGHSEEAKADIADAVGSGGGDDANVLAVAASLGDDDAQAKLAGTAHPYAAELKAKEAAFDEAAAKFAIAA
ncbi:hypothetical protein CspeluHIS016_0202480 [Cutaneotrichosporon spelunceum]|uniref:Coatomer subunit epsilon n=1 Tax=Cutaneotrichosporon spelunceum TaxID=1672016 RepID=A0AAD3YAT4_9TREE|nr:hypothetical protein CspeluHIS016_0202480 [Cutaneotrichosporon spelunceum]